MNNFTNEEAKELDGLLYKRASSVNPITQDESDRIDSLKRKMYHNHCLNPQCTGYCGTDDEKICKYCGHDLFKNKDENG